MKPVSSNTTYDDITITTGLPTGAICTLIKVALAGQSTPVYGAVHFGDYDYNEVHRLMFQGALVDEVDFPALDPSSKDAARMQLKLAPQKTVDQAGSGQLLKQPVGAGVQKVWLASAFRLGIDGIPNADSAAIARVDPIVVKRSVMAGPSGVPVAGANTVTPLALAVQQSHAPSFAAWAKTGVAKNGTIDFLAQDVSVVLSVQLRGLLPTKITPVTMNAQAGTVPMVRVEMTAQGVALSCGSAPLP